MESRPLIVLTAVIASLLEILDVSIVNVAIPRMQGNLGTTLDEITWISTGYIISNAVVLPIASWLGERIGRRTYFTSCIVIFTLASLACGFTPGFGFLVACRVIQGAAGGALLPTAQTLIQEQFPGPEAGIGSAIYGMSVMIGPALGPTVGGYLTDNYGWRWIFFINLPIGLLAALLSMTVIPARSGHPRSAGDRSRHRVDLIGFTLLVLGVGALQFMLERGQADDWFTSNLILGAAVVAGLALPLFWAYEYRHKNPIVDVKLFADSTIRSGTLLMASTGMVLFALVFIVPVYTDRMMGMDATQTGLLYVPSSLATMACMPVVGTLMSRIGPKPFILLGIGLVSICLYKLAQFTSSAGYWDLFWPLMARGIGLGCLFVPINTAVLSQFEGRKLGQAAGLLNLFRQIGGSVGIAGMSTFLDRFSAQFRMDLAAQVSRARPEATAELLRSQMSSATRMGGLRGIGPWTLGHVHGAVGSLKALQGRVEQQVFQLTFNRLLLCMLAVYMLSLIPLARMKLEKKAVGPVTAH
jgi:DHA2 family multidrug resistance protein